MQDHRAARVLLAQDVREVGNLVNNHACNLNNHACKVNDHACNVNGYAMPCVFCLLYLIHLLYLSILCVNKTFDRLTNSLVLLAMF